MFVTAGNRTGRSPSILRPPQIRNASMITGNGSSVNVPFPPGTQAQDLVLMQCGGGYGANNPSGWTVLANSGVPSFWGGATWWKFVTSSDVNTGYVTVTFANSYRFVFGLVALKGAGGAIRGIGAARNVPSSTSQGGSMGSAAYRSDLMIYFGCNRSGGTGADMISRGSELYQITDGVDASGCLFAEVLMQDDSNPAATFYFNPAGSGNYVSLVGITAT